MHLYTNDTNYNVNSNHNSKNNCNFNTPLVPPCKKATDVENFCGGRTIERRGVVTPPYGQPSKEHA